MLKRFRFVLLERKRFIFVRQLKPTIMTYLSTYTFRSGRELPIVLEQEHERNYKSYIVQEGYFYTVALFHHGCPVKTWCRKELGEAKKVHGQMLKELHLTCKK